MPLAWFVPFAGTERWLGPRPGRGTAALAAHDRSMTRALLYVTPMPGRAAVARGLAALRGAGVGLGGPDAHSARAETELAEVARWLERFHPYSLVELDYGGLVNLLSDDALRGDESVAEVAAAIDGMLTRPA